MNTLVSQGHIIKGYDRDMAKLGRRVLRMGSIVHSQLQKVKEVLEQQAGEHESISQEILDADDSIDRLEIKADKTIIKILARRAPVGQDLRYLVTASRVVTELERLGDEATQIARALRESEYRLGVLAGMDTSAEVRAMLGLLIDLCDQSCQCFGQQDKVKASELLEGPTSLNGELNLRTQRLQRHLLSSATQVNEAINITLVIRALERGLKYTHNICEHVIYLVTGQDVRHPKLASDEK